MVTVGERIVDIAWHVGEEWGNIQEHNRGAQYYLFQ